MYPISSLFDALTVMSPESNSVLPTITLKSVVLPQPLGPKSPYLKRIYFKLKNYFFILNLYISLR